jgi:rare lipoprotein A
MHQFKMILFIWVNLISVRFVSGQEKGYAINYKESDASRVTSSSELYDPGKLTAAHNTLPMGTLVNVSRLDNGISVVVRINDRGPFIPDRILALSKSAAIKLGLKKYEKIMVQLHVIPKKESQETITEKAEKKPEIPFYQPGSTKLTAPKNVSEPLNLVIPEEEIKPQPVTIPLTANRIAAKSENELLKKGIYELQLNKIPETGFAIQIGSFQNVTSLWKEIGRLHNAWFKKILIKTAEIEEGTISYKLMIGPFPTKEKASSYKENLNLKFGISGFIVSLNQE